MTKTLSEQLCEIVGLEYKKKYSYFVKKYPDREYSEAIIKEVEGVLNFEQPENFVKLWEIINTQSKQELIQRLIMRLRVESGWYTDGIKQSIHDYDGWVWR